ncbi:MAG: TatD family deoxyribonuclease [Dehalococcoidia bacterium]|nr:MAG: TatD family deoxyribonuclease [Dehalococcoidia bacterium]
MAELVDSHCHLDFEPLGDQLAEVLTRARGNGVGHMLCVSVTLENYPKIQAIAEQHSHIFSSVGVHPNEREGRDPDVDELVTLAANPRVVAIGETGLDYYRSQGDMGWQQDRFRRHIQAARQARKPLIIHTRDAAADTLAILREENAAEAGAVMHCFTESWDVAKAAMDLGFYISFSGIVTFANAAALREVAAKVPDDRLLVETDSPYLAPVPYRGKTNEPAYVRHVAERLAEVRGVSFDHIADVTTQNFFNLFQSAQRLA